MSKYVPRYVVLVRANSGLLRGGLLELASSPFRTEQHALDFAVAITDSQDASAFILGPERRIEISPACDLWMAGARYGQIEYIDSLGILGVRLDKQPKRVHRFNPRLIQRTV